VQEVNLFLWLHPSRYLDDSMQVAIIGSLLSGNAFSCFAPFLEKRLPVLQNMAQFEALFTTAFGDSDRERMTKTKMQSLRQETRSIAIYVAEVQQLTCVLEWNDKAFINRFWYDLKDNVKDLLITMSKVESLQEFITQATICDNRLFERHQEKRFGWRNANHNMISTSLVSENNTSGLEPMQIDVG
jgi:hypothetical protein